MSLRTLKKLRDQNASSQDNPDEEEASSDGSGENLKPFNRFDIVSIPTVFQSCHDQLVSPTLADGLSN